MAAQRKELEPSVNRDNSIEKNLALWEAMKLATPEGLKCSLRVKIDYKSLNGALRDPVIYRCKPEIHIRTGDKYKVLCRH